MGRGRFKTHVEEAYRVICERGLIDDGELQYLLDLSLTTYYRVRRALLAVYHDVEYEKGFLKLKRKQEGEPLVEYWGELEPSKA
jgi:hypothetical protein